MKTLTLEQFQASMLSQAVPREHMAVVCPMCKTVQSGADMIKVGAGQSMDQVGAYLGFSCVGRFTGAEAPRKSPDGKPCNWTLGGLLSLHELEVITPDGVSHPHFEPESPEAARAHMAENT